VAHKFFILCGKIALLTAQPIYSQITDTLSQQPLPDTRVAWSGIPRTPCQYHPHIRHLDSAATRSLHSQLSCPRYSPANINTHLSYCPQVLYEKR